MQSFHSLGEAEAAIARGLKASYVDVGRALDYVRGNLVPSGGHTEYRTFEEYCQDRWDITPNYAYQLIFASQVHDALASVAGDWPLPPNPKVACAAGKVYPKSNPSVEDKKLLGQVWQCTLDTAPRDSSNSPMVTAAIVNHVVEQITDVRFRKDQPDDHPDETQLNGSLGNATLSSSVRDRIIVERIREDPDAVAAVLDHRSLSRLNTSLLTRKQQADSREPVSLKPKDHVRDAVRDLANARALVHMVIQVVERELFTESEKTGLRDEQLRLREEIEVLDFALSGGADSFVAQLSKED